MHDEWVVVAAGGSKVRVSRIVIFVYSAMCRQLLWKEVYSFYLKLCADNVNCDRVFLIGLRPVRRQRTSRRDAAAVLPQDSRC